jgi:hypothetical protein
MPDMKLDFQQIINTMREQIGADYSRQVTELAVARAEKAALLAAITEVRELAATALAGPNDGHELVLKQIEARLNGSL